MESELSSADLASAPMAEAGAGEDEAAPLDQQPMEDAVAASKQIRLEHHHSVGGDEPSFRMENLPEVIKGLDEGILSMKVGGLRRLYIPGPLAFPKGLTSAPGRPRVAPSSPVVFDVNLLFIPGLDDE